MTCNNNKTMAAFDDIKVYSIDQLREYVDRKRAADPFKDWLAGSAENQEGFVKLTWVDLVAMAPQLSDLERSIRGIVDDGSKKRFCQNALWYRRFKPVLENLVGSNAYGSPPAARTSAAYDIAYDYCYDLLPECRNCFCLTMDDLC